MNNPLNFEESPLQARVSQFDRSLIDLKKFRRYIFVLSERAQMAGDTELSRRPNALEGELVDVVRDAVSSEGTALVGRLQRSLFTVTKDVSSRKGVPEDLVLKLQKLPEDLNARFVTVQQAANRGEIAPWPEPASGFMYPGGKLDYQLDLLQGIIEKGRLLTKQAAVSLGQPDEPDDDPADS